MDNGTRHLLFALLLFITGQINAQIELEDRVVVYHEDGSVFIGALVYEDLQDIVMILSTSDTIFINKDNTRKIKYASKHLLLHTKGKYHYIKGFFAAFTYGNALSEQYSQQTDLILGMRLDKKYSVGLGIGMHTHSTSFGGSSSSSFQSFNTWNWVQNNFIPIYAYGRYYPWDFKLRPFADMKLGYSVPNLTLWGDTHSGGIYFQPSIGVHFSSRRNFRWTLALSQAVQYTAGRRIAFDTFSNEIDYNYKIWYNRTTLTVGLEFH